MDELLSEFLAETQESLENIDANLITLEKNPEDENILNEVFRLFHTVKGTSGFLELPKLGELAHAAESLISLYRDKKLAIDQEGITVILASVDGIKEILHNIETNSNEGETDLQPLLRQLATKVASVPSASNSASNSASKVSETGKITEAQFEEISDDDSHLDQHDHPADQDTAAESPETTQAPEINEISATSTTSAAGDTTEGLLSDTSFLDTDHEELADTVTTAAPDSIIGDVAPSASAAEVKPATPEAPQNQGGKILKGEELDNFISNLFDDSSADLADQEQETDQTHEAMVDQLARQLVAGFDETTTTNQAIDAEESAADIMNKATGGSLGGSAGGSLGESAGGSAGDATNSAAIPVREDKANQTTGAASAPTPTAPAPAAPPAPAAAPTATETKVSSESGASRRADQIIKVEKNQSELQNRVKEEWSQLSEHIIAKSVSNKTPQQTNVKVNLGLLEEMMNSVSELVLTRNQLVQIQRNEQNADLQATVQRLNLITTELQERIMKTRMQPIETIWGHLPRLIRTISLELNKSIDLSMTGEDTEVDRQVLERIRDPLTHIVRNSCDHGIELPAARRAAGKPETGIINLRAYQEAGFIMIEISDDGGGIDVESIREKIISTNRMTVDKAHDLSDSDLYNVLFEPGFSTAQQVTSVSGRGVGMDVVKTNITKLGGSIVINSIPGSGTVILIRIPLSLVIVTALLVRCKNKIFAVPQLSIIEVGNLRAGSNMQVKLINDNPVIKIREGYLPLLNLAEILELADKDEYSSPESYENMHAIIMHAGNISFALAVEEIHDSEEIVVKPLSQVLQQTSVISGNTILGDGKVIMILDPSSLAAVIGKADTMAREFADQKLIAEIDTISNDYAYLLFEDYTHSQLLAINLLQVKRIEELQLDQLEYPSGRPSLIYQDQLMPVIRFDEQDINGQGSQMALIFESRNRLLAMLIKQVHDIVESNEEVDLTDPGKKVAASTIIMDKGVDLVDLDYFFNRYLPDTARLENSDKTSTFERFMLVETNPVRHALYRKELHRFSISCEVFGRSGTALRSLRSNKRYHGIIIAESLPDIQIAKIISEINNINRLQQIPLYIICENTSTAEIENYLAMGAKGCLDAGNFLASLQANGFTAANTAASDIPNNTPNNTLLR